MNRRLRFSDWKWISQTGPEAGFLQKINGWKICGRESCIILTEKPWLKWYLRSTFMKTIPWKWSIIFQTRCEQINELPACRILQAVPASIRIQFPWGNEDTSKILEILKKHDVHVTFFMTGGWVESYPDDVKAILAAGDWVIIVTEEKPAELSGSYLLPFRHSFPFVRCSFAPLPWKIFFMKFQKILSFPFFTLYK